MAKKDLILLYIQIKASSKLPRIKGSAITKLKNKSFIDGALPVVATLQPILQLVDHDEKILNNDSISISVEKKIKWNSRYIFMIYQIGYYGSLDFII